MKKYIDLFNSYVDKFDINNEMIKRKYYHSLHVMEIELELAKFMNLSNEEVELAGLCGLLHDIGRFKQAYEYNTFDDFKSINHGVLGLSILTDMNYINLYTKNEEWKNIILKSTINHNKTFIDSDLTEKEKVFVNLTRDADKLDIFEIVIEDMKFNSVDGFIKDSIYNRLYNLEFDYEIPDNELDRYGFYISLLLDINYKRTYEIILEKNYLNRLIDKIINSNPQEKNRLEVIREKLDKYIKEKVM